MSSLRLALKQSLQESGQLGGKKPRSNRNRGDKKRSSKQGSRGNRSHGSQSPRRRGGGESDEEHHSSDDEENEFSAGDEDNEETEEEDDNEEDDNEEGDDDDDDDEQDRRNSSGSNPRSRASSHGEEAGNINESDDDEDNRSDEERRRRHRKLQKKLKHSAANKIQSQWKKKKDNDDGSEPAEKKQTSHAGVASIDAEEPEENPDDDKAKSEASDQQDGTAGGKKNKNKKKGNDERGGAKGKTAKTVPPPIPEVLEWNRTLPVKQARRNVAQGLRVKVRFATKVKRDGKILRKKKWFGGRVSAVSKEGSKIRIKYDDGTAEISKFPDKDVCVDAHFNGEHVCDATTFQPPSLNAEEGKDEQETENNAGSKVMDEERAPTPPKEKEVEKKPSPSPQPVELAPTKTPSDSTPMEVEQPSESDERKDNEPAEAPPADVAPAEAPPVEKELEAHRGEKHVNHETNQETKGATPVMEQSKPLGAKEEMKPPSPPNETKFPEEQSKPADVEAKQADEMEIDLQRKNDGPPKQAEPQHEDANPTSDSKPLKEDADCPKDPKPQEAEAASDAHANDNQNPSVPQMERTSSPRQPTPPLDETPMPTREPTPPPREPTPLAKASAPLPTKVPTPPPTEPRVPSPEPFEEPMEEVVRPPSPPIPSETENERPPSAPIEVTAAAVPKLKLTLKSALPTAEASIATTDESKSQPETSPAETQRPPEAKADSEQPIAREEMDIELPLKTSESEMPVKKGIVEKAPVENPKTILSAAADEKPVTRTDVDQKMGEAPSGAVSDASANAEKGEQDSTKNDKAKEDVSADKVKEDSITDKEDKGTVSKDPSESAKPSLTIRLVNPKKDSRALGNDPKSPRIKISSLMPSKGRESKVELDGTRSENNSKGGTESENNSKGESSTVAEPGPKSAEEKPEKAGRLQKRRRSGDESGLQGPPTKRIQLQLTDATGKDGTEPGDTEAIENQAEKLVSGEAVDDDGPVKMVGRVSAKRVPLFSEDEDEEPTNQKDAATIQKPKAKPASVPIPSKDETAEVRNDVDSAEGKLVEEPSTLKHDKEKILVSSRNSAFEAKAETVKMPPEESVTVEVKNPRPSTPTTGIRPGRKAAQQANERIVTTKQDAEKEGDKDKEKEILVEKKRKRKEKDDEDSESSNEDVNNWVQCFSCKKWRIIPNHIMISSLPDRWYCHLNVDPKRNSCDAPEQTARTPVVKKKKSKKRKLRQRAEAAAVAEAGESTSVVAGDVQQDVAAPRDKLRARSPAPKDEPKPKEKEQAKSKEKETTKGKEKDPAKPKNKEGPQTKTKPASRASPSAMSAHSGDGSLQQREMDPPVTKKSKQEKKVKRLPDEPLEPTPEVAPPEVMAKGKRGRKARKEQKEIPKEPEQEPITGSFHVSVTSQPAEQDPDNVEWVQCDSCSKWRKLPPHISADELPEVWYCSNNTWNPSSASCEAPEDKADGQQDIGPSIPSPGGSKLSYRNLIFGNTRKVNRPVSERTRAAESIFATPSDDSETGYPTVMYANSSAFAPRGSRANIIEDENHGQSIFDLMHHSNLFAELRGVGRSLNGGSKVESGGLGKAFMPKFFPRSMRQDIKDLVLLCLKHDAAILGEEVAEACQTRRLDNAPSLEEARKYCTKDVVIMILCELVTEGKVQILQAFGRDWSVKDWVPRYRLTQGLPNENAEAPAPKSRSMKIAKPWKQKVFTS